jgi:hypothetical protein
MSSKKTIAFIETPNQSIFLRSTILSFESLDLFFIKRKKWSNNITLLKNYFPEVKYKFEGSIFFSFLILIFKFYKYKKVIFGSHLGVSNKAIILLALVLNYKVIILDDGLYSTYDNAIKWISKVNSLFKDKLKWFSYYKRGSKKNFVVNYCINSLYPRRKYSNTCFLALSDFEPKGISEETENKIIDLVLDYAKKNKFRLILIPHRRGRHKLYKKKKLEILRYETNICFEDWYITSKFEENCEIYATGSSLWNIFEDKRLYTNLIDVGEGNINWIKENCYINQIIDKKIILNYKK